MFALVTGAKINTVFILRIQTKSRLAAILETASLLSFGFSVGGQHGSAAVKNAGAFASVVYPDFVIACNNALDLFLDSGISFLQFYIGDLTCTVGTILAETKYT